MKQFWQGGWLIALVCILIGFMIAVQFRTAQDGKGSLSQQRIEEISDRLLQTEHERDELGDELRKMQAAAADQSSTEDQRTLAHKFAQAGWQDVKYRNLSGGIVAIHRGFKPQN